MVRITEGRRSPAARFLLVVSILLALLWGFWAIDRLVLLYAQSRVAGTVAEALGAEREPEVGIGGGLVIPQLLRGSVGEVEVRAEGDSVLRTEAGRVVLRDLSVAARDVRLGDPAVVGEVEASAVLPDETLAALLTERVPAATVATGPEGIELGSERLTAVLGQEIGLTVRFAAGEEGGLRIQPVGARLAVLEVDVDELIALAPAPVAAQIEELLATDIAPEDLGMPAGVRPSEVEHLDGGLRLTLTGEDVVLEE